MTNNINAKKPENMKAIIPSLFTIANMGLGFFSLLACGNSEYVLAAWFIIFAIFMDMLDGRVARLIHGESSFGVEIDSLSDWISFGIAPAFLLYHFVLKNYGIWGYPVTFFYVVCGAIRLAKYNIEAHFKSDDAPKKSVFRGLPIPAAGGILASFVLSYSLFEEGDARSIKWLMNQVPYLYGLLPFIMILLAFLMVSKVPYGAFKKGNILKPKSVKFLFLIIAIIFFIIAYPQNSLFLFFSLYAVSGIIAGIVESFFAVTSKISDMKQNR